LRTSGFSEISSAVSGIIIEIALEEETRAMEALEESVFHERKRTAETACNDFSTVKNQHRSPQIKHVSWGRLEVEGRAEPYKDAKLFPGGSRSEEHTSELQSRFDLVCR